MNQVRHIEFAQYNATNLHAATIVFMAIMAILVFAPKRTTAAIAVLSVCIFMPMAQRVVVGGLDFPMSRLIAIMVALRVLIKGEHRSFAMGKLDRLVLYWVLSGSVVGVLRVGMSGVVPSLGHSFDVLASYLIVRILVRTPGEVLSVWKQVAWIVIVLSPLLFYEMQTRHNLFGVFTYEGVDIAPVRNGKVRARGPISHPILAGTFGAVVIPVFIGIFRGQKKSRGLMAVACVAGTIVAVASGSSGPLITWGVGLFGWMLWVLRERIRAILWAMVAIAVVLHLVREKPVWHLISATIELHGRHRWPSLLLDRCVHQTFSRMGACRYRQHYELGMGSPRHDEPVRRRGRERRSSDPCPVHSRAPDQFRSASIFKNCL